MKNRTVPKICTFHFADAHYRITKGHPIQYKLDKPYTGNILFALVHTHPSHRKVCIDGGIQCPFQAYPSLSKKCVYKKVKFEDEEGLMSFAAIGELY